ncbi:MAG TPA: FAD:protein FMN transferase [Woeseiaceae bacterium]|nr:FAD:protein FMN transferase [Woeseiaceae bacterium]
MRAAHLVENSGERERRVDLSPTVEGGWCGRFFAMGSPCEVLVECTSGSEAFDLVGLAATEAWRIEDKYSRYLGGNIVARINSAAGEPVEVDEETSRLLGFAATLHSLSGGRFDITSGALRRVWRFDTGSLVPAHDRVRAVLSLVGWHRATWQPPVLVIPAGMEIDLGGIGKEYAVDRAVACLRDVSEYACLVNFGGDLAVTRVPQRRKAWHVGIESLRGVRQSPEKLIRLEAGALATSGDTRRFVLSEGQRFGHILDPRTGWPVRGAPASVTVAADSCIQAGTLCTLAMLEGDGAEHFLRRHAGKFWVTREES